MAARFGGARAGLVPELPPQHPLAPQPPSDRFSAALRPSAPSAPPWRRSRCRRGRPC